MSVDRAEFLLNFDEITLQSTVLTVIRCCLVTNFLRARINQSETLNESVWSNKPNRQ